MKNEILNPLLLDKTFAEEVDLKLENKVSFYEKNGYILDALTVIEKAIVLNPNMQNLIELKRDIIERAGIKIFRKYDF